MLETSPPGVRIFLEGSGDWIVMGVPPEAAPVPSRIVTLSPWTTFGSRVTVTGTASAMYKSNA
jgi:hypothetical protein